MHSILTTVPVLLDRAASSPYSQKTHENMADGVLAGTTSSPENPLPNYRRDQESSPFRIAIVFWRGTPRNHDSGSEVVAKRQTSELGMEMTFDPGEAL